MPRAEGAEEEEGAGEDVEEKGTEYEVDDGEEEDGDEEEEEEEWRGGE